MPHERSTELYHADFFHSSYRERLIEHLFVGEVLRTLWLAGITQAEVLKSEVDGAGYDLVLEVDSVVRHVQLKSSRRGGKRADVDVQLKLAEKPGGCVIWLFFDPDTLTLGPYYWFGDRPGQPLPKIHDLKPARQTRANAKGVKAHRPALRLIPKSQFEKLESIPEIVERLFGVPTIH